MGLKGRTEESEEPDEQRRPWSPREARRIRMAAAGTIMAVVAVVLVLRLSAHPSLLTVGVYGAGLVLCGVVIELSRRGRTRLGTWLLAVGLVAVAAADQLLGSL
ncbi:hypothetical protein H1D24_03665 [Streptomyces sp. PSKA28]|uniref:Uncharacterized protein n=1 Tax=Streptomyces himalayensis subsp. himalayensis TaxID=2756131 RepID=A0A7W0I7F2_9ACTN|nr:hypothetical protein [Streptomyces himalayensis subsp. himalayensis]